MKASIPSLSSRTLIVRLQARNPQSNLKAYVDFFSIDKWTHHCFRALVALAYLRARCDLHFPNSFCIVSFRFVKLRTAHFRWSWGRKSRENMYHFSLSVLSCPTDVGCSSSFVIWFLYLNIHRYANIVYYT